LSGFLTKNILIHNVVDPTALQRLRSLPNIQVDVIETEEEELTVLPAERIRSVHILFCTFPPKNFSDMTSLELVQLSSVGYEQLYGLGLTERLIRACNALGVFDVPIAEWNLAMMVNLARDLPSMLRNQQAGLWDRSAAFQREIRGSVVGIWGYGGIGRETARLCKTLGLTVHVLSRCGVKPRENIYRVPHTGDPDGSLPDRVYLGGEAKEFLRSLNFLILSMPLTKSTNGIIGERELKLLPTHAFVLNPARGPLIQEGALLQALREGWIAGAALDTHYYYPMPEDHPLWRLPNVIMTPHISGSVQSPHFKHRIWDIFVQNVERYLTKQPLLNELASSALEGD
jgi:phosphoglycerate dehydrogenase-like enzyme